MNLCLFKLAYTVMYFPCSTLSRASGFCSEGVIQSSLIPCETTENILKCHNSYQDSQNIGYFPHYRCPEMCVPIADTCQGISFCEMDWQICGPQLRCSRSSFSSPLVNNHHFCTLGFESENNQKFERIDRADEEKTLAGESSLDVDISEFKLCNASSLSTDRSNNNAGLTCGKTCYGNEAWCADVNGNCKTNIGSVATTDERICGNPLLMGSLYCPGIRCRGTKMACTSPWYTRNTTFVFHGIYPSCEDKSDQVFNSGLTCREHFQLYLDYHDLKFCSEDRLSPSAPTPDYCGTRKEKEQWLSEIIKQFQSQGELDEKFRESSFLDPHNCQGSCNDTQLGLDCVACSNTSYFPCPQSDECVHPDLVCDGHPQCSGGKDESLEMCHQKYIDNKIVKQYASYRCTVGKVELRSFLQSRF